MTLKTYQAATMAEALAQVKQDLGRNAVILHTRNFRKGGLMGLIGGRGMWEVTASPNVNVPARFHNGRTFNGPRLPGGGNGTYVSARLETDGAPDERNALTAVATDPSPERFEDISIEQIDAEIAASLAEDREYGTGCVAGCVEGVPPSCVAGILPASLPFLVSSSFMRQQQQQDAGEMPATHAGKMPATHAGETPATHAGKMPATQPPDLTREIGDIKRMMESLLNRPPLHAAAQVAPSPAATERTGQCQEFYAHLLRQDVEETIARKLIDQLVLSLAGMDRPDSKLISDRLCDLIASRIQVADATPPGVAKLGRPHVIALVGPTGVGKTTTIAKLAANYKLRHNRRVGLVTVDNYRIAAVDQLRTYAEIIEAPMRTVLSAGELHQAVHGMENMDVVLIDTAGRSQNDHPRLNELRTFIAAAGADEVHLLISATANHRCVRNVIDRFGSLGVTKIVLTKLDEAETYGTILSFSAHPDAPLSFVTTGQDVPDDIEPADAWRLATLILKGRD